LYDFVKWNLRTRTLNQEMLQIMALLKKIKVSNSVNFQRSTRRIFWKWSESTLNHNQKMFHFLSLRKTSQNPRSMTPWSSSSTSKTSSFSRTSIIPRSKMLWSLKGTGICSTSFSKILNLVMTKYWQLLRPHPNKSRSLTDRLSCGCPNRAKKFNVCW